ncbi:MAG: PAS domain S-box protein [Chloroflexota bacterium]
MLFVYAVLLSVVAALILFERSFDILWPTLMLPIFAGAVLYAHRVYWAMLGLYIGFTLPIVLLAARDPVDSFRTISVFIVAVAIGAEFLHRFVTWLEAARAALRASEARFRSLSVMAPLGIFETDAEGHYVYTNPRWQAVTGFSAEAGLGKGWIEAVHPDDRKTLLDNWEWAIRHGREFTAEFRLSFSAHAPHWVRLQSAVKYSDAGVAVGRVGTLEDITQERAASEALMHANEVLEKRVAERTERLTLAVKQLEVEVAQRQHAVDALRYSEERFSKAFNASPSPIIISSALDGRTIDMNESFLQLTGYTREDVLGQSSVDLKLWRRPEDRARMIAMASVQGSVRDFETVIRPETGDDITVLISAEPITLGSEKCVLTIATDITARKSLEVHLRDYAETQRLILQQRVAAQETERRRLSMDVHDGPLQSLGVSLIALDRAMRRLERGEPELAYAEMRYLRTSMAGTVSEMRSVLADLSLDALTSRGLIPALEDNMERFTEVTGISVEMDSHLDFRLPGEIELLLYRLAQEALANIRKHSEATKVLVRIETEGNDFLMTIADDGRGFNPDIVPTRRRDGEQLGLASMRERVVAMRGTLEITSAPGAGTKLRFRCPIPAQPV